jgi:hypothetical protein
MGFLSDLLNGKRQKEKDALDDAQKRYIERESRPAHGSLGNIHLEGERTATVYVYDGRPLKGIKKDQRFVLEAIPGNVTMKSTLTGTVWNNRESGDLPLAYNGTPVGFTKGACEVVGELLSRGHSVTIAAVRTGTYDRGIPEIEVLLPPWNEVQALVDPVQKAKNEGLIIEYNVGEDQYKGTLRMLKKKELEADVVLLPKKEGSSAKQHIAIVSKKDGSIVDEFNARRPLYKQFADHIGRTVKVTVEAKNSFEEGSFYYHFEVDLRQEGHEE